MTAHCTANRGRNGNKLIIITEKTICVYVEIILFRKNLKDEVKLQKKYGLIVKIIIRQNYASIFQNLMPDAEGKDVKG